MRGLTATLIPLFVCVSAAAWTQEGPGSIAAMTDAANAFMASLSDEQKSTALKSFDEVEEREKFIPVPFPTTGLRFDALSEEQIQLAHGLLKSGLSAVGYEKASQIIELDDYLVELESLRGRAPRFHGSQNYNVLIFLLSSTEGTWG